MVEEYASPEEWRSLDLIYDLALRELDAQASDRELVDGRLGLLLGFIGVIFVGVLGLPGGPDARRLSVQVVSTSSAVLLLVLSAILAFLAYLPREFHRPPSVRGLRLEFLTLLPAQTKLAIVDQALWAYDQNQRILSSKRAVYSRAAWLFMVRLVFLAIAVAGRLLMRG